MSYSNTDTSIWETFGLTNIEMASLIKRFLRNWYWVVLFGVVGVFVGREILNSITRIYSVSSKVLIDTSGNQNLSNGNDLAIPLSPFATGSYSVANEIEILKSRRLMTEVVSNLDLQIAYYGPTTFGIKELYGSLPIKVSIEGNRQVFLGRKVTITRLDKTGFRLTANGDLPAIKYEGVFGKAFTLEGTTVTVHEVAEEWDEIIMDVMTVEGASRRYLGGLSVSGLKRSEIIRLAMEDPFIERAKSVLAELINVYDAYLLRSNRRSSKTTIDFIDQRLASITQELFEVEREVEEYKKKIQVPLDLSSSTSSFLGQIESQDEAYSQLQLRKSLLREINQIIVQDENNYDYLPYSSVLQRSNNSTNLIQEYNALVAERNKLLISATEDNPQVLILNDAIQKLRENIKKWIELTENELAIELQFVESRINPIESTIEEIPRYERELLQIIRQQKIKESLFTYLLQRREETAISLAAEVTNVRIIDFPAVDRLVSPNSLRVYFLTIMALLLVPSILIFLRELMDDTISISTEVQQYIEIPMLGFVLHEKQLSPQSVITDQRSTTAETLRLIRTNLNFLLENDSRVLLVTSFKSGEGKTFMSINLANTIANAGKSVAIVELDLRKPKLSKYLGLDNTTGMSIYLNHSNMTLNEVEQQVDTGNGLTVFPSGPVPPNPAELISRKKLGQMINELKEQFDYVILDSAPIGLVADSLLLSEYVDVSVLVGKSGITKKKELKFLSRYVNEKRLKNPGFVLNGVKKGSKFGYYGSYGSYGQNEKNTFGWLRWIKFRGS